MENKFIGTIPGVAFSKFEYTGDPEGFVTFLKELEGVLDEVPDIFGINPQNKADITTRLEGANKMILGAIKEIPELKVYINKHKAND